MSPRTQLPRRHAEDSMVVVARCSSMELDLSAEGLTGARAMAGVGTAQLALGEARHG